MSQICSVPSAETDPRKSLSGSYARLRVYGAARNVRNTYRIKCEESLGEQFRLGQLMDMASYATARRG